MSKDEPSWKAPPTRFGPMLLSIGPAIVVSGSVIGSGELINVPVQAATFGFVLFWAALPKVFPETREQRCWVHKTANVLNKMPKSVQPRAKAALHEIWQAETRQEANQAFDNFLEKYAAKFPAACECLKKDREVLLTFYDFPAEHWKHLRTTNSIESTFATIRLRHRKTKGSGTRRTSLGDDVQAWPVSRETLETLKRPRADHSPAARKTIRGWSVAGRRLEILTTQHLTITP